MFRMTTLALAAAATFAVIGGASTPASARDDGWRGDRGYSYSRDRDRSRHQSRSRCYNEKRWVRDHGHWKMKKIHVCRW